MYSGTFVLLIRIQQKPHNMKFKCELCNNVRETKPFTLNITCVLNVIRTAGILSQ